MGIQKTTVTRSVLVASFLIASVAVAQQRVDFRLATYNINSGSSAGVTASAANLWNIAVIVWSLNADVVALQEVTNYSIESLSTCRSNMPALSAVLSNTYPYSYFFPTSTKVGRQCGVDGVSYTIGNAIFSKHPVVRSWTGFFPNPRDLSLPHLGYGAVEVVGPSGDSFIVYSTHFQNGTVRDFGFGPVNCTTDANCSNIWPQASFYAAPYAGNYFCEQDPMATTVSGTLWTNAFHTCRVAVDRAVERLANSYAMAANVGSQPTSTALFVMGDFNAPSTGSGSMSVPAGDEFLPLKSSLKVVQGTYIDFGFYRNGTVVETPNVNNSPMWNPSDHSPTVLDWHIFKKVDW